MNTSEAPKRNKRLHFTHDTVLSLKGHSLRRTVCQFQVTSPLDRTKWITLTTGSVTQHHKDQDNKVYARTVAAYKALTQKPVTKEVRTEMLGTIRLNYEALSHLRAQGKAQPEAPVTSLPL